MDNAPHTMASAMTIQSNLNKEKVTKPINASTKEATNDYETTKDFEETDYETDSETSSCCDFEEVDSRFGIPDELELLLEPEETFFKRTFNAPKPMQLSTREHSEFKTQQQYLAKATSEIETENAMDLVAHRKRIIKLEEELKSCKRIKTSSELEQEEKEKKFLEEKKRETEELLKSAKSAPRHVSKTKTEKFVLQKDIIATKKAEQKKREEAQRKEQEEKRKSTSPKIEKRESKESIVVTPPRQEIQETPQAPIKRVYKTPENTLPQGSQKFFWNFVDSPSTVNILPSILDFESPISKMEEKLEKLFLAKVEQANESSSEDEDDTDTVVDEPIAKVEKEEVSYERIQPTIQAPTPKIEKEEWVTIAKKEKPKPVGLGGRNLIPQAVSEIANQPQQTRKTQMCKSILSGVECKFGNRCSFAHSESQLFSREAPKRTDLPKTKMCQSILSGVECKFGNRCSFAHSESQLHVREQRTEPKKTDLPKTRMCQSIVSGAECKFGNRCSFAHNIEELHVRECNFGNQCKLVCQQGEKFYNANSNKICTFIHPEESKQVYEKRTKVTTTQPKIRERTDSHSTHSSLSSKPSN